MKKTFVGVAAIALALGGFSCNTGISGSSELKTGADTASYAQGLVNGNQFAGMLESMKEQAEGPQIDKEAFLKGFEEALADSTKFGYFAGGITGSQMLQQFKKDKDFNYAAFMAAFRSALAADSVNFKLTVDSAQTIVQTYQEAQYRKQMEEQYSANKDKGKAFIDNFQKEEGVKTTASGLAYKVLTAGTGATPTATDKVKVSYVGTTIDGTEFDKNEGMEFTLDGVIKGWTEMLQLMKVGDKVKVVIPHELAYGEKGSGYMIEPYSTLVFEIELLEIVK